MNKVLNFKINDLRFDFIFAFLGSLVAFGIGFQSPFFYLIFLLGYVFLFFSRNKFSWLNYISFSLSLIVFTFIFGFELLWSVPDITPNAHLLSFFVSFALYIAYLFLRIKERVEKSRKKHSKKYRL